jgi:hypothetical protein
MMKRFAANSAAIPSRKGRAERPYTPGDIELAVERLIEEGAATRDARRLAWEGSFPRVSWI